MDAGELRKGLPARVSLDAFRGEDFPGTLGRVAPYVLDLEKQARTVEIDVVFTDPEVRELVESARRHLGVSSILRLLVRAKGELGERVRKDESVIRARELAREIEAEFQSHISGEDWAIIEGMDGVDSVALANRLKGNTMGRLSVEFRGLVGPADHPSVVIEELWLCLAEGDGAGVAERVGKLEALGIKMPAL